MFWRNRRAKRNSSRRDGRHARFLRVEFLEPRHLLSGNVTAAVVGGALQLTVPALDFSDNAVQIWQVGDNQFYVKGKDTTSTQINGSLNVAGPFNGVTNVSVNLGEGSDTFEFDPKGTPTTPGAPGTLPRSALVGSLTIANRGSGDVNNLYDVQMGAALNVSKDVANPSNGKSTLLVQDCIIAGNTVVDNSLGGSNGDSATTIKGSDLRGNLSITNATGYDWVYIDGSRIAMDVGGIAVAIANGNGASQVRFSTFSGTAYNGTVGTQGSTFWGALNIVSGDGFQGVGLADQVTFSQTEVKGGVTLNSNSGDSVTGIGAEFGTGFSPGQPSHLGTDVVVGGPLTVRRGPGNDQFNMTNSDAQWGLSIDNRFNGPAGQTSGSTTTITASKIGTIAAGSTGLAIMGDDGADTITLTNSTIGGGATITGNNGADAITLTNTPVTGAAIFALGGASGFLNTVTLESTGAAGTQRTSFGSLTINGGADQDRVTISSIDVALLTNIQLAAAADYVNVDYQHTGAALLPLSSFIGVCTIDGGAPGAPDPDQLDRGISYNIGTNPFGVFGTINNSNFGIVNIG